MISPVAFGRVVTVTSTPATFASASICSVVFVATSISVAPIGALRPRSSIPVACEPTSVAAGTSDGGA